MADEKGGWLAAAGFDLRACDAWLRSATKAARETGGGEQCEAREQDGGRLGDYSQLEVLSAGELIEVHAGKRAREPAASVAAEIALRRRERAEELVGVEVIVSRCRRQRGS